MESTKSEAESMLLSAEDSDACQAWIFNPPHALDKTICELETITLQNSEILKAKATDNSVYLAVKNNQNQQQGQEDNLSNLSIWGMKSNKGMAESMPDLAEDGNGCQRWKFDCGHYSDCFSPEHIFDKTIHEIEAMEEDHFEKAAKSYYFSDRSMRYIDNVPNYGMLSREGVEDENVSQKVGYSVEVIDLCDEVENLELSPSLLADNSAVQPSEGEHQHPR
jgi:hypothetical protein